jgi:hypothetical protein
LAVRPAPELVGGVYIGNSPALLQANSRPSTTSFPALDNKHSRRLAGPAAVLSIDQLGASTTVNISARADAESAVAVRPPTVPGTTGELLSAASAVIRPAPAPVLLAREVVPAGGASVVVADDFSDQ